MQEYKLWYDRPAQVWTEALPLGNGRLGAMVYGIESPARLDKKERAIICNYTIYILNFPVKKKSMQIIIYKDSRNNMKPEKLLGNKHRSMVKRKPEQRIR